MKIMKIVYLQDCEHSSWDGGNSQRYMGEETWKIGEYFAGEFMSGIVSKFIDDGDGMIDMWIELENGTTRLAISFPNHAIQRIYYGEG